MSPRKLTPTQLQRKRERERENPKEFTDGVKKIQASMARSIEHDSLDDQMIKELMVKMLLISLTEIATIPEMIRLSQEISKLRGLYASAKTGAGKTQVEEDEDEDELFQRLVDERRMSGRESVLP